MSVHIGVEITEADTERMDRAEIAAIRAWLSARNSGRPYRVADYSLEATLTRLRWLLEYAERVGRTEKRKCGRKPKDLKDMEHLLENYQVELQRLWKIETRYRALRRKVERSSRWVWSRDGGRP